MEKEKINLIGAMMYLQDNGIKQIAVNYSGGGDSGGIDEVLFRDHNGDDVDFNCNNLVNEFIEELSHNTLEHVEDWYNNDGGWGQILIEVPTAEYTIKNNVRISNYETFDHEGQFESEE